MPRWILWGIAAVSAAAAVWLIVVLWRRRRAEAGGLTTGDYLVALGIALALFGTVVSALAASNTGGEESAEVKAYRSEVQTVCDALAVNNQSVDLALLMDASGNIDRQRLIDAFNAQIDAALEILGNLWAKPFPEQLSADVTEAHRAADVLLWTERGVVNDIVNDLSDPARVQDAVTYVQTRSTQNLPNATAFQAAMSQLAGDECRAVQLQ